MITPLFILEPLERPLTALLEWLHTSGGLTWAWAIVATTMIVRTVLLPLTVRQIHSMQRLQRHAPEMKAIQQRYKQDRAKQQEELMKFYKENKINPAASCLPILFQIPVFLALFFVLKNFEKEVFPKYPGSELGWLWNLVPDITQPLSSDPLSAVILLILYAASQTASTYFMSSTMDKMQRYLLLALPLIFLFFVINFPAGLMIYWVTTNLWTTGQGLVTRKLRPKPVAPEKRSSRTPPGGGDGEGPRPTPRRRAVAVAAPTETRQEEEAREAMSEEPLRVETTGETVGEAKWAALRELEQPLSGPRQGVGAVPGADRGRARTARRRLHAGARRRRRSTRARHRSRVDESAAGSASARARGAVAAGIGVRCRVDVREDEEAIHVGLRRYRARPADRQARPDDRCDPVPRERGRATRRCRRRKGRRRGRRRLPRPARARRSRRWPCARRSGRSRTDVPSSSR